MKALSFRQPWAELILQGRKTMDCRTYNSHYRGRIAIHASQTVEAEPAWANDLNPENLDAGGIVGTVELVDVIPLDEATYTQHRGDHLSSRSYRKGLYGWVLARPERLPEMIPASGRTNLFHVDLALAVTLAEPLAVNSEQSSVSREPSDVPHSPFPDQSPISSLQSPSRKPTYNTHLNGTTPEKPFALHLQPVESATTDYALTLRQRVVERPESDPHLETVVTISGDNLRAVADHVIEALRKADYKATDLSPTRQKPFYLPEEIGVRVGLVFLTVKPLTKIRRVEEVSYGIRQMPSEEVYYWYSKCTAAATADRAQKALRILLAAE